MKKEMTLVSTRNELGLPLGLFERRGLVEWVRERWPTVELANELPEVLVCFYIIKAEGKRDYWETKAARLNVGEREAAQLAERDLSKGYIDGLEGSRREKKNAVKSVYRQDAQYVEDAKDIAAMYRLYAEQLRRTIGHASRVEVSKRGLNWWLRKKGTPQNKLTDRKKIQFITDCLCTDDGNPFSFETARSAIAQNDVSSLDKSLVERLDEVYREWSDGHS